MPSNPASATFVTRSAPEAYQSRDADFIITLRGERGEEVLRSLGYSERGGVYRHSQNSYTLDFPPGPLSIGNELIKTWETTRRENQLLHVLSRTDSVRDRLLWFFIYNDRSALSAALGVAASGAVDVEKIRAWSIEQGFEKQYEEFSSRL